MGISTAWINGRTLGAALKKTGTTNRFGRFSPNERVPLDLARDNYLLGIERTHGFPFVAEGNFLVTIHDFDQTTSQIDFRATNDILAMANLRFTRRALESAISDFVEDTGNNDTLRIEGLARGLDIESIDQVFEFSKEVCAWGRGGRVWGNLRRFHTREELGQAVSGWLRAVANADRPSQAIAKGIEIKGLGVSFASKHLRLFDPERFATLDEVISVGLGYALNSAGYDLWLHDLQQLKHHHALPFRIADIESGIFVLIRQIVRGTNSKADDTQATAAN